MREKLSLCYVLITVRTFVKDDVDPLQATSTIPV